MIDLHFFSNSDSQNVTSYYVKFWLIYNDYHSYNNVYPSDIRFDNYQFLINCDAMVL